MTRNLRADSKFPPTSPSLGAGESCGEASLKWQSPEVKGRSGYEKSGREGGKIAGTNTIVGVGKFPRQETRAVLWCPRGHNRSRGNARGRGGRETYRAPSIIAESPSAR